MPDFSFEQKYLTQGLTSIGVDEVGRGCLAGPVVAAAVAFPTSWIRDLSNQAWVSQLNDSKLLTLKKRIELSKRIQENLKFKIAWSSPEEIDGVNILHASMAAMRRTLSQFTDQYDVLLVDGNMSPFSDQFRRLSDEKNAIHGFKKIDCIIKGDQRSLSIAAASIVAKVYRDQWMLEFEEKFPGYGFSKHKGYSTKVHQEALLRLGPCKIHRKSFEPVRLSSLAQPLK